MKTRGEKISREISETMCKAYRSKNPGKTESVSFDKSLVDELMNAPGAKTLKVSFGLNDDDQETVVLSAVTDDGIVLMDADRGQLCPPNCTTDPDDPDKP